MKRVSLTAVLCVLAGCASMPSGISVEAMLGTPVRDGGFYGSGPTATIRIRQSLNDHAFCEYEHISHLLVGPPFGPKNEEDSLDQFGCGLDFQFGTD